MKRFKTRYAGTETSPATNAPPPRHGYSGVQHEVIDGDSVRIREAATMLYKGANISPEQKIINEIRYRANSVSDEEKLRLAFASATTSKNVEQYNHGYPETSAAARFNAERGLKKGDENYAKVRSNPTNEVRMSLIQSFEYDEVGGPAATSSLTNILDKHLKREPDTSLSKNAGIQTIDITLSPPDGNQQDHFRRPLRHFWRPSPTNNKKSILVSKQLVSEGHGLAPNFRGGDRTHYAKVKASEVLSSEEVRAKRQPLRSLLLKSGRDTVPGQGHKLN